MPVDERAWVPLRSAHLSAAVNPLGAELSLLRDRAGRDLLWNGDPAVWTGRAPVLFPIVGELAGGIYRLGAQTYRLSRHGFARRKPFELLAASATAAAFRLKADASTLQVYPFHFQLDVGFVLEGPALSVTLTVRNEGQQDMPASFGYHPAFRWPLPFGQPRSAHYLEFALDESEGIRRLDAHGLMTPERHPTPVRHRRLALADSLFTLDAVIFDELRSRCAQYGAQAGPRIRVTYADAAYLGVWTKPGAQFICIEPWHGLADPTGFAGDFRAKPGILNLAPKGARSLTVTIALLEE